MNHILKLIQDVLLLQNRQSCSNDRRQHTNIGSLSYHFLTRILNHLLKLLTISHRERLHGSTITSSIESTLIVSTKYITKEFFFILLPEGFSGNNLSYITTKSLQRRIVKALSSCSQILLKTIISIGTKRTNTLSWLIFVIV